MLQDIMIVTRTISWTNFVVASTALRFRHELDAGFDDLKKEHLKILDAVGNDPNE